ncbi:hypothetical protein BDP27DRAFT_509540 [Rhodocollybia butyracea]|uniref:Uncharacterized protein n=1 Tax=Rhodocollybia butyracea TaxID=206335 RepID=A0A9P5U902_9AGAR|nr:hypothetical protein BDP27DRAFT_509540 [Rhodocollybia butyracea]
MSGSSKQHPTTWFMYQYFPRNIKQGGELYPVLCFYPFPNQQAFYLKLQPHPTRTMVCIAIPCTPSDSTAGHVGTLSLPTTPEPDPLNSGCASNATGPRMSVLCRHQYSAPPSRPPKLVRATVPLPKQNSADSGADGTDEERPSFGLGLHLRSAMSEDDVLMLSPLGQKILDFPRAPAPSWTSDSTTSIGVCSPVAVPKVFDEPLPQSPLALLFALPVPPSEELPPSSPSKSPLLPPLFEYSSLRTFPSAEIPVIECKSSVFESSPESESWFIRVHPTVVISRMKTTTVNITCSGRDPPSRSTSTCRRCPCSPSLIIPNPRPDSMLSNLLPPFTTSKLNSIAMTKNPVFESLVVQ